MLIQDDIRLPANLRKDLTAKDRLDFVAKGLPSIFSEETIPLYVSKLLVVTKFTSILRLFSLAELHGVRQPHALILTLGYVSRAQLPKLQDEADPDAQKFLRKLFIQLDHIELMMVEEFLRRKKLLEEDLSPDEEMVRALGLHLIQEEINRVLRNETENEENG